MPDPLTEIAGRLANEYQHLTEIGASTPELGNAAISRADLAYLLARLKAAEAVIQRVQHDLLMDEPGAVEYTMIQEEIATWQQTKEVP